MSRTKKVKLDAVQKAAGVDRRTIENWVEKGWLSKPVRAANEVGRPYYLPASAVERAVTLARAEAYKAFLERDPVRAATRLKEHGIRVRYANRPKSRRAA